MLGKLRSRASSFFSVGATAGWEAAFTWSAALLKHELGIAHPQSVILRPRQAQHPLVARLEGTSDMDVFRQIFCREEYGCVRSIRSPAFILDLGANVGYSSAYFLSCFPDTRVLAVEPDPANFAICAKNLSPYGGRAKALHAAVWSHNSTVKLSRGAFSDGRDWATQVIAAGDGGEGLMNIESFDIPTLLNLAGEEHVDLLKVDIERSELNVFGSNCASWLSRVRNICIELHGEDCRDTFVNALKGLRYDLVTSGDLTFCHDLRSTS